MVVLVATTPSAEIFALGVDRITTEVELETDAQPPLVGIV